MGRVKDLYIEQMNLDLVTNPPPDPGDDEAELLFRQRFEKWDDCVGDYYEPGRRGLRWAVDAVTGAVELTLKRLGHRVAGFPKIADSITELQEHILCGQAVALDRDRLLDALARLRQTSQEAEALVCTRGTRDTPSALAFVLAFDVLCEQGTVVTQMLSAAYPYLEPIEAQ